MLGSDMGWAVGGGEQAAHALLLGGAPLPSAEGWLAEPKTALLQPPNNTLTVPVLLLQFLVLLLFWYSGRTSVDAFVVRLLLNHQ